MAIFFLLDADDSWDKNKISKLKSQIEADNQCLLFQQNLKIVDETGKESNREHFRDFLVSGSVRDFMLRYDTLIHNVVPTSGLTLSRGTVPELLPEILDFRISADGLLTRVASRLGGVSSSWTTSGSYCVTGENSSYNNKSYSLSDHQKRLEAALKANYYRAGRTSWLPLHLRKSTRVLPENKTAKQLSNDVYPSRMKTILRNILAPLATRFWSGLNS